MTFILTIVLWTGWVVLFFTVSPSSLFLYIVFLILLFMALLLTLALVLGKTRWGTLVALGAVGMLIFYQFEQLTIFNGLLFIALLSTIEYYLNQKSK